DEAQKSLTAHHLYPWNQIQADLNKALKDQSGARLKAIFTFARGKEPAGWVWDELAMLGPQDRSYRVAQRVNLQAPLLCWNPGNIVMGRRGKERGDDPGEARDEKPVRPGMPEPGSAVAELIERQGGLGEVKAMAEKIKADLTRKKLARAIAALNKQRQV